HITIGIDNQEPIELPANYKDKELVRTIINDNIVEKTHDINNKEMIFSALKEIYDGDPGFIFDKISHKLRHTVTEFDESGKSEPTDLFTWYGKDKKGDSLAIVIKNKNGNDYLSLGYYDQDDYHIQRGIRINGDSLTQYCSENARSASAWFESSKAIMAESFATGSDHQVVNELNGERLREPNEVFKRLGRAIRYNFQVDDAKFRRDNVKEII
ncbi:TPA: protein YfdF, partial [Shigella flexneri]